MFMGIYAPTSLYQKQEDVRDQGALKFKIRPVGKNMQDSARRVYASSFSHAILVTAFRACMI